MGLEPDSDALREDVPGVSSSSTTGVLAFCCERVVQACHREGDRRATRPSHGHSRATRQARQEVFITSICPSTIVAAAYSSE